MAADVKVIQSNDGKADDKGKKRMRSPAYPYINLEMALKRAKEFNDKEGRGAAYLKVAAKHWGYEEKSSGAQQTAAALISFGLLSDQGTGDKRKVQLTQTALRIILDKRTDSSERDEAIKQVALAPKIHSELWKRFDVGVSNEQLRHTLILDWVPPFNENSVDGFIREYRDTIAYAKLIESDKVEAEDGNNGGEAGDYVPKVGDYVRWESQGAIQHKEPVKILSISSDRTHAFVEGTSTGLPVNQLIPSEPPVTLKPQIVRATQLPNTNVQEDIYSLPEGRIVVQWPAVLSEESIQEVKDYLKLLERKIVRSTAKKEQPE